VVGESTFLLGCANTRQAVASTAVAVLQLPRHLFFAFVDAFGSPWLLSSVRTNVETKVLELLKSDSFKASRFAPETLTSHNDELEISEKLTKLVELSEVLSVPPNTLLYQHRAVADGLFIVLSGQVTLSVPEQDDMVDSDEEGDGKKQEEKRAQLQKDVLVTGALKEWREVVYQKMAPFALSFISFCLRPK